MLFVALFIGNKSVKLWKKRFIQIPDYSENRLKFRYHKAFLYVSYVFVVLFFSV